MNREVHVRFCKRIGIRFRSIRLYHAILQLNFKKYHYCPNVVWKIFCNYLNTMKFNRKMFFFDTNSPMSHTSSSSKKEMAHGYWETCACPNYGFSADLQIPSMRSTIPRSLQNEKLFMLGSVSLHGLCSTHLSRESERYRSLPSIGPTKTLSHGYSGQSLTQYFGPCQPGEGLADLCRLRPDPYRLRSASLCQRFLWSGVVSNRLCFGLHPHRFMSLPLPMGQVPETQRSHQITHPFGSARKHSFPCRHYSWEDSRCDHPRSTDLRTRSLLYRRSRVSRFCSPLCDPSIFSILRDQSEKQFQLQTSLLSARRQIHRCSMQPNYHSRGILCQKRLPRKIATDSLFRCDPKQTLGLLNQQLYATCVDHRPTFSVSLANLALLQMDQTTSSNQSLLWYNRERRQNTDMDCHHRLCVGGNRQKTFEARPEPLHNSTDFKYLAFRKNPDFRGIGRC
jgi:hypothetical protein